MADAIARRPWKVAKYAIIMQVANALAYAAVDADEDEERRALRPTDQGWTWIPGVPRMMRLTWDDKNDAGMFLDVKRWIPIGDLFDTSQGSAAVPIPSWLQFGGPLMLAMEGFLNKQAFNGQEITNKLTDSTLEQWADYGSFAWKSYMPSTFGVPGSWYTEKLMRAATGARDTQGRSYSFPQALASSVGVKVSPQDMAVNFRYRKQEFDRTMSALKSQRKQAINDRNRGVSSNAE
ncbi:MAG: hypothetical protein E4H01_07880 [Lysobacterales bacterium]|nr:MAG: hypothetical protein E4H01_07880 [Xanthomonadales bacterium]